MSAYALLGESDGRVQTIVTGEEDSVFESLAHELRTNDWEHLWMEEIPSCSYCPDAAVDHCDVCEKRVCRTCARADRDGITCEECRR